MLATMMRSISVKKKWEDRQNLHVFNLWPVKYHTKKNSCANPTPERLSVEIYTSQQDYPKSTRFLFCGHLHITAKNSTCPNITRGFFAVEISHAC
jgi:hypothetical protein